MVPGNRILAANRASSDFGAGRQAADVYGVSSCRVRQVAVSDIPLTFAGTVCASGLASGWTCSGGRTAVSVASSASDSEGGARCKNSESDLDVELAVQRTFDAVYAR